MTISQLPTRSCCVQRCGRVSSSLVRNEFWTRRLQFTRKASYRRVGPRRVSTMLGDIHRVLYTQAVTHRGLLTTHTPQDK